MVSHNQVGPGIDEGPTGGGLVLLQGDRPLHAPVLVDHHEVGVLPGLGDALTDQFIALGGAEHPGALLGGPSGLGGPLHPAARHIGHGAALQLGVPDGRGLVKILPRPHIGQAGGAEGVQGVLKSRLAKVKDMVVGQYRQVHPHLLIGGHQRRVGPEGVGLARQRLAPVGEGKFAVQAHHIGPGHCLQQFRAEAALQPSGGQSGGWGAAPGQAHISGEAEGVVVGHDGFRGRPAGLCAGGERRGRLPLAGQGDPGRGAGGVSGGTA